MRRGWALFGLIFVMILLVSFVSAFSFSDITKFFGITGNAITDVDNANLVSYYNFDEAEGDDLKDNNELICSDCPTTISGKFSDGVYFDGAKTYLEKTGAYNVNRDYYSIAAWIKVNPGDSRNTILEFAKSDGKRRALMIAHDLQQGKPVTHYGDQKGRYANTADLRDGQWHHLVSTMDSSGPKIYLDGVEISLTAEESGAPFGTSSKISIGKSLIDTAPNYFNGTLDEVRLYNRALSVAEVKELYNYVPSVPAPIVCGNGIVESGEECDDGNKVNGDGCSSSCQIETINQTCTDSDGVVEQKEINEGASKEIAGLNIKMINADETNLNIKATINVEGYGDIGFDQADEYGFLFKGINYLVELVSASDIAATIKVNSEKNYFVKGLVVINKSDGTIIGYEEDGCQNAYVLEEGFCYSNSDGDTEGYNCPNGCSDGACLQQVNTSVIISGCYLLNDDVKNNELFKNGEDSNGDKVHYVEDEKIFEHEYVVVDDGDGGSVWELISIYNDTSSATGSEIKFRKNVVDIQEVSAKTTNWGTGTIGFGTKSYTFKFSDNKIIENDEYVTLDFLQTPQGEVMSFENCVPNIKYSYLNAYPSLVKIGDNVSFSYYAYVTKDTLSLMPQNYSIDILDENNVNEKSVNIDKLPYEPYCYNDDYDGVICQVSYSSSYPNYYSPNSIGFKTFTLNDKNKKIYVVESSYFDQTLVLDEQYGTYHYYGYYDDYWRSINLDMNYLKSNKNYEVVFYEFFNETSSEMFFNQVLNEIIDNRYTIKISNESDNIIYLLGYKIGATGIIASFWKSDNELVVVSNRDFNFNTTSPAIDAQDLVNALVGQGNSYSLESPNLEDIDPNQLGIIKAYLEKHPSTLTGNELNCIPKWECSLNPLVCPSHGEQLELCEDANKCSYSVQQRTITCVPGICSGCLAGVKYTETGSVPGCVPYGFRVSELKYDSKKGEERDFFNYCDIGGRIMEQKGDGAKCNNNYECYSNECRAGQCTDTYVEVVAQAGLLKRIWCAITTMFGTDEDYRQCLLTG